jgi:hypothetical protein
LVAAGARGDCAALQNFGTSLNSVHAALRQNAPKVEQILVTDNTGNVLAALGDFEYKDVVTPNYFSEIHVRNPITPATPRRHSSMQPAAE